MSFETVAAWGLKEWGTAAMIGSTGLQVVNMGVQAMQQNELADASASAAEANAARAKAEAERNAQVLEQKRQHDTRLLNEKFEREQASRRVFFGKYGAGDSPLEVLAGAAQDHEMDLLSLDYSTDLEKQNVLYGGETSSAAQTQQAQFYRVRAQNALTGAPMSMGESLLSGGAKAYQFYKGK